MSLATARLDEYGKIGESVLPVRLTADGIDADIIARVDAATAPLGGQVAAAIAAAALASDSADTASAAAGAAAIVANSAVKKGSLVANVKDYGAVGNGTTDDGAAIQSAIDALSVALNSDNAAGILYFPVGKYIDGLSHTIPSTKRITLLGSGEYSSTLQRAVGASGDWWTFNGSYTGAVDLGFDGNRAAATATGDAIVLNGADTFLRDCQITKIRGNGLSIGKAGAATSTRLRGLRIREASNYGIRTTGSSGSLDGMWSGIEVGMTGLSGVRLDSGSQNIDSIHIWYSGMESLTDRDGLWLNSTGNLVSKWQTESNLGWGLRISASTNQVTNGRSWGNVLGGAIVSSANLNNITGNEFYRNAVGNTAGTVAPECSSLYLSDSLYNVITGNTFSDSALALAAGTEPVGATYPYPGRSAILTQTMAIYESGTCDRNVYTGNSARKDLTRGALGPVTFVGFTNMISGNDFGDVGIPLRTITGGAIRVPQETAAITVSQASEITSVLGHAPGRTVAIIFTAATPSAIRDNGTTLNLAGDFTPTTNDVITLISDGTVWREVSRSAN